MSYSDEPNLVRGGRSLAGKKLAAIVAVVVFVGLVLSAALSDPYHDWRKARAARGPKEGTLHRIEVRGVEHEFEFGWVLQSMAVWVKPALPEGSTLRLHYGPWDETLEWFPQGGYFGPSKANVGTEADLPLEIELTIDGQRVWTGKRWAYGKPGHAH